MPLGYGGKHAMTTGRRTSRLNLRSEVSATRSSPGFPTRTNSQQDMNRWAGTFFAWNTATSGARRFKVVQITEGICPVVENLWAWALYRLFCALSTPKLWMNVGGNFLFLHKLEVLFLQVRAIFPSKLFFYPHPSPQPVHKTRRTIHMLSTGVVDNGIGGGLWTH